MIFGDTHSKKILNYNEIAITYINVIYRFSKIIFNIYIVWTYEKYIIFIFSMLQITKLTKYLIIFN